MQSERRSGRWTRRHRRSSPPMTHDERVLLLGFMNGNWRLFEMRTLREWRQRWRGRWIVERWCCSLRTCDGILEEVLQSTDEFELFYVNRTNCWGGKGWVAGRGVCWAYEIVVGKRCVVVVVINNIRLRQFIVFQPVFPNEAARKFNTKKMVLRFIMWKLNKYTFQKFNIDWNWCDLGDILFVII